jgi:hypothetical protein
MKGLNKGRYALPDELVKILFDYWSRHGKTLKEYRDIAQHHALVTSHTTLFRGDDGRIGLHALLPSNPGVKCTGELVWGMPPVHAQRFLRE